MKFYLLTKTTLTKHRRRKPEETFNYKLLTVNWYGKTFSDIVMSYQLKVYSFLPISIYN
jgi:hypothetical protein